MVNDLQEKFFCPRLIDYIVVVGSYTPLSKHSIPTSEFRSSRSSQGNGNPSEDGPAQFSRSSSVTTKTRSSRPGKNKKTSLYSVGRALTCSSFSISSSSVSHIQVDVILASTFQFYQIIMITITYTFNLYLESGSTKKVSRRRSQRFRFTKRYSVLLPT